MSWLIPEPLQRHEVASTWPERKYSEKLENIRLIFRLFIQWFIFFWTINIAMLQLHLRYVSGDGKSGTLEALVAAIFIVLNVLGVGVCHVVGRSLRTTNRLAHEISIGIDGAVDRPFDSAVVNYSTGAAAASLLVNCLLWSLITALEVQGPDETWKLLRSWLPG